MPVDQPALETGLQNDGLGILAPRLGQSGVEASFGVFGALVTRTVVSTHQDDAMAVERSAPLCQLRRVVEDKVSTAHGGGGHSKGNLSDSQVNAALEHRLYDGSIVAVRANDPEIVH